MASACFHFSKIGTSKKEREEKFRMNDAIEKGGRNFDRTVQSVLILSFHLSGNARFITFINKKRRPF
jgi:hypothetical protein